MLYFSLYFDFVSVFESKRGIISKLVQVSRFPGVKTCARAAKEQTIIPRKFKCHGVLTPYFKHENQITKQNKIVIKTTFPQ